MDKGCPKFDNLKIYMTLPKLSCEAKINFLKYQLFEQKYQPISQPY